MAAIPQRILGIDFSGAKDAGRKAWLTIASADRHTLHVEQVIPASRLSGGTPDRALAYAALRRCILDQPWTVVGMDFPFSVARSLAPSPNWALYAASFAALYPNEDTFYRATHPAAGQRETRRACDAEARTPFAAQNLRLYRQTYYGIRDVLAPLLASGGAWIAPLTPPIYGAALLLEICPASSLKAHRLYAPYKGTTDATRAQRQAQLAWLRRGGVRLSDADAALVEANAAGDALDSVWATWAAWRALLAAKRLADFSPRSPVEAFEGRVYYA